MISLVNAVNVKDIIVGYGRNVNKDLNRLDERGQIEEPCAAAGPDLVMTPRPGPSSTLHRHRCLVSQCLNSQRGDT